ncbi:hypothetical protein HDV03_004644 [Kappamyces sp. JEL0829]|nr:hypothetical protein HDV03_004644 [Kappamyces sp. JEL0829]
MTAKPLSICVYCGSSPGNNPSYMKLAAEVGREIGRRGYRLVYGGGDTGLMGAVARAALEAGAAVLAVTPRAFSGALAQLDGVDVVLVDDMHTRKQLFLQHSDGFVCLPGGFGTLEEVLECITWRQLGIHSLPVAIFDADTNYFGSLRDQINAGVAAGFIHHTDLVSFCSSVNQLFTVLAEDRDKKTGYGFKWTSTSASESVDATKTPVEAVVPVPGI